MLFAIQSAHFEIHKICKTENTYRIENVKALSDLGIYSKRPSLH